MEYVNYEYLTDKGFSVNEARKIINMARAIMEKEKYYVPFTRPKLANKKIVERVLKGDKHEKQFWHIYKRIPIIYTDFKRDIRKCTDWGG